MATFWIYGKAAGSRGGGNGEVGTIGKTIDIGGIEITGQTGIFKKKPDVSPEITAGSSTGLIVRLIVIESFASPSETRTEKESEP